MTGAQRARTPEQLRSYRWFGADPATDAGRGSSGLRAVSHRSRMRQLGVGASEHLGKPFIAILNTWAEINPCHMHLRERAEQVRRGVWQAGGFPLEFPVATLSETFQKPTPMLYRNLLAMETEELLRSYPVDGAVLMGGCDKTTPALVMGAASAGLPAIFVPAGPMLRGNFRGAPLGSGTDLWKYWDDYRAGLIGECELSELEGGIARSPGHCMTMGTASTMTSAAEALGLTVPGAASIPAVDSAHYRMAAASGHRIVEMVWENLTPSRVLTREAFEDAAATVLALGGSTNALIHLIAMAGRCGVPLTLDDFDAIARRVPVLANIRPGGTYLMEDFYYAGGLPALLGQLAAVPGALHPGRLTVSGAAFGAGLAGAAVHNDDVIRAPDRALSAEGGVAVLRGNLAPRGAVIKHIAADPRLLRHTGPAVVFDDYRQLREHIDDPALEITPDSVLVLRNAGPVGGPGMPEYGMLPIPRYLLARGVRDMVRISDSRMSGTSYGACVLHVSPESAARLPARLRRALRRPRHPGRPGLRLRLPRPARRHRRARPPLTDPDGGTPMTREIDRRALLRLSALAGASTLAAPLLAGPAGAATASGRLARPGRPAWPGGPTWRLDRAADQIVVAVRRPWFPDRFFPVTQFGAVGDGVTDCTAAFAAAISACSRRGGHVIVPPGSYVTGAIHLLSDVDLHLEPGATILFSQDPNAYLPVVFTRWQGIELMNYSPFIYCYGQRNVAVTGQGVLDGQADDNHWWDWKDLETADFDLLETMADDGVPVSQRVFGAGHYLPPQMIQPFASDTVLLEGVTVQNSPFWHLNPNLCTNVTVFGLSISSSGPNTDGCDPESCDGVVIDQVTFDTGDDCIAIKSGRDADGRRVNVPCQNIVIQNSDFADGHGGITVGSEMTGGVANVYARDLTMNSANLQAGHRIKTNTLRGGYVENTNVYRVDAGTIGGPVLLIDAQYDDQTGAFPADVTDINLIDWTVTDCEGVWSILGASAADPVGTATLDDLTVTTSTVANSAQYITDLVVEGVTVGGQPVVS